MQIRQLIEQKNSIFYTDESKVGHHLDHTQDIIDAELYAVSQAIKWVIIYLFFISLLSVCSLRLWH